MTDALTLVDVRDVWEQVRPGLDHVKLKVGAPWRPEDIYAACIAKEAFLYQGETGFIIVQPKTNPFNGTHELLVWVAFAEGEGNIARFQDSVDKLAREHNFSRLTMWSNRLGFSRVPGWAQVAVVYEREL